jgi:hypothetical protein
MDKSPIASCWPCNQPIRSLSNLRCFQSVEAAYPCCRRSSSRHLERAVTGFLRRFFFGSNTMISPRFEVKEEILPACSREDYANPDTADLKIFRRLKTYIGIIRASA